MGERPDHLKQATANKAFADSLIQRARASRNQTEIDWAVIAGFYSALHLIEAMLADHDIHPKDHKQRADALDQLKVDEALSRPYEILQDYSEQARYGMRHFELEFVENGILTYYLGRVEEAILHP